MDYRQTWRAMIAKRRVGLFGARAQRHEWLGETVAARVAARIVEEERAIVQEVHDGMVRRESTT